MRTTTTTVTWFAGALALALVGSTASAMPSTNAPLPMFRVADITGQMHHIGEVRGRPAFVAVLTSSHAGDPTRAWMDQAQTQLRGSNVRLITVVSLDLSPFVPTSMVRNAARDQTPRDQWATTWIDRSGAVRRALGLPKGDRAPYIFALDANGNVRASAHGSYDARAANRIFSSLRRR